MKKPPESGLSSSHMVEIDAKHEGQRIDNFLLTYLKGVPRSRVYRVLRKGEVRVNKARAKPDYRLQEGDLIRIPPLRTGLAEKPAAKPSTGLVELLNDSILYEDEGLLIINKPSGLAVHGGSGVSLGVIEILRAMRSEAHFLELVHRLDRETSGCLMIAKKRSALRSLHSLLREGGVDKRYLALLKGKWRGGRRVVSAALRKNVLSSGERVVRVSDQGKTSETVFEPVEKYAQATLVEASPQTGRTHQIRVHAAHLGQPIAGDDKYGDTDFNRQMRELGLRRLFLHASSLTFTLPGREEAIVAHAPLDAMLQKVLDQLS